MIYLFSTEEITFDEFTAGLHSQFTPSLQLFTDVLHYQVALLDLMRTAFVVSSQQTLVLDRQLI